MTTFSNLRIAVLFGGRSGEHEVSLTSAKSVLGVLSSRPYQVFEVGITHEGVWLTGPGAREKLERGDPDGL
ncbi:MAG: D-alanine--D-alanine ligase A, partial [Anaerolineales bacterium]|nr:D-alanine--D-alanine ligase A [Anaerolineales bacterium]